MSKERRLQQEQEVVTAIHHLTSLSTHWQAAMDEDNLGAHLTDLQKDVLKDAAIPTPLMLNTGLPASESGDTEHSHMLEPHEDSTVTNEERHFIHTVGEKVLEQVYLLPCSVQARQDREKGKQTWKKSKWAIPKISVRVKTILIPDTAKIMVCWPPCLMHMKFGTKQG